MLYWRPHPRRGWVLYSQRKVPKCQRYWQTPKQFSSLSHHGTLQSSTSLNYCHEDKCPVRIPRVSMQGCANYCPELRAMPETQPRIKGKRMVFCYQNRQMSKSRITSPRPAKGPYCFNRSSQLMRTAARLYLRESSRKREDMSPIFSNESPR